MESRKEEEKENGDREDIYNFVTVQSRLSLKHQYH